MKKFLALPRTLFMALLRYPRITLALGVFLLIGLVWVAGPEIGMKKTETRILIIAGILFLWSLFLLLDRFRADQGAKQLEASLRKQAEEQIIRTRPDRRGEIETLQVQFDKAIAALKQSKVGRGRRGTTALYAIPWYMFIGPPASGKSTALQHSGLNFPYLGASGRGVQGIGGTRNCDWWFTSDAVLLDTAGRYVTEEDDREEWLAFLDMLKKCRKGKPVNGVLAAVNLPDLLQATEEKLEEQAKNIRERIDELIQRLGIVFPVYLVLTKCDLIHGFVEFFEDFSRVEREQVWGSTLPLKSHIPAHQMFDAEFQVLLAALQDRRMERLASARSSKKIRDIYGFPLQLASGRENLTRFVEILFQHNPYQENPLFRGFYFTSGTQEGTPIDRILTAVSRVSGLPDAISIAFEDQKETKSYFIKNLFTDIIFPDQVVAYPSSAMVQQRGHIRVGVFIGAALILLFSLVGLSFSFVGNKYLVRSIRSASMKAAQINIQDERQFSKNVELLDRLGSRLLQLQTYAEEGVPLRLRGGLYQGDILYPPLWALYFDRFYALFAIPTQNALEVELDGFVSHPSGLPTEQDSDYYYALLKAYLMMSDPDHIEPAFLADQLQKIWSNFLRMHYGQKQIPQGFQEAIFRHLAFYSNQVGQEGVPLIRTDEKLIKNTRRVFLKIPTTERLYTRVRRDTLKGLEPYTLEEAIRGRKQDLLTSTYSIPGLFSQRGWQTVFRDTLEKVIAESGREGWVLGIPEPDPDEIRRGIEKLYFSEYIHHWRKFLESIRMQPMESLSDTVRRLEALTQDDSPLAYLLTEEVVRNTDLEAKEFAPTPGVALNLVKKVKKRLNIEEDQKDATPTTPVNPVSIAFGSIHRFVAGAPDKKEGPPFTQYQGELSRTLEGLQPLMQSEGTGQEAKTMAQNIVMGGSSDLLLGFRKVERLLSDLDPESKRILSPLLLEPFRMALRGVMDQARIYINNRWRAEVHEACLNGISGRYPFQQNGEDAGLADVADFFNPQNGIFWKFYERELTPFILEEGTDRWNVKKNMEIGLSLSSEFLENMKHARLITNGLFPRGQSDLNLSFGLYPYPTPGVSATLLQLDGMDLRYRNEPQEWHEFTWPGSSGTHGALLEAQFAGTRQVLQFGGWWGWFKLLDAGQVIAVGPTRYQLEWDLKMFNSKILKIRYDLKAGSYKNPFKRGLFTRFKCVANI